VAFAIWENSKAFANFLESTSFLTPERVCLQMDTSYVLSSHRSNEKKRAEHIFGRRRMESLEKSIPFSAVSTLKNTQTRTTRHYSRRWVSLEPVSSFFPHHATINLRFCLVFLYRSLASLSLLPVARLTCTPSCTLLVIGMLAFGFFVDRVGRKSGMLASSAFIIVFVALSAG
jgi:hypothetical protein